MRTANFTDLRKNLKGYLDAVINDSDTVIINRDGNTGVVIMSLDEYNAIKDTEYLMSSPETMRAIREGQKEIEEGQGLTFENFEAFQKWADSL